MNDDISTEQAMIVTERIMRAFGDVIGGDPRIMERIVFRVVCGDGDATFRDDDGEV